MSDAALQRDARPVCGALLADRVRMGTQAAAEIDMLHGFEHEG